MDISGTIVAVSGALGAGLAGGGWVGSVVVKRLNKPVDDATAEKIKAEAREAAARTAASEVDTMREVLAEVRQEKAATEQRLRHVEERLARLEERERHALTRAAVHEAWDQLAFNFIANRDQTFPPPPPLTEGRELPKVDNPRPEKP